MFNIPVMPHSNLKLLNEGTFEDGTHTTLLKYHVAQVDPTPNDDGEGTSGLTFRENTLWLNETNQKVFVLEDSTATSAQWKDISAGGGVGGGATITRPTLTAPSQGSTVLPDISFSTSLFGASDSSKLFICQIQLAKLPDFSDAKTLNSGSERFRHRALLTGGVLYARARHISDSHVSSEWSESITFSVTQLYPTIRVSPISAGAPILTQEYNTLAYSLLGALVSTEVQISSFRDFRTLEYLERIDPQSTEVKLSHTLLDGTWYLRARSWSSTEYTDWAPTMEVEVGFPQTGILSPVSSGISLTPTLKSLPFEPRGVEAHIGSIWRVFTDAGMTNCILHSQVSTHYLTSFYIPEGTLQPGVTYYWDCQHIGSVHTHTRSTLASFSTASEVLYQDLKLLEGISGSASNNYTNQKAIWQMASKVLMRTQIRGFNRGYEAGYSLTMGSDFKVSHMCNYTPPTGNGEYLLVYNSEGVPVNKVYVGTYHSYYLSDTTFHNNRTCLLSGDTNSYTYAVKGGWLLSGIGAHNATELITLQADRDFSGVSGNWTGADWEITGGKYTHATPSVSTATLSGFSPTAASQYRITLDIDTTSTGSLRVSLGGVQSPELGGYMGSQKKVTLTILASSTEGLSLITNGSWVGNIDNISVTPILVPFTIYFPLWASGCRLQKYSEDHVDVLFDVPMTKSLGSGATQYVLSDTSICGVNLTTPSISYRFCISLKRLNFGGSRFARDGEYLYTTFMNRGPESPLRSTSSGNYYFVLCKIRISDGNVMWVKQIGSGSTEQYQYVNFAYGCQGINVDNSHLYLNLQGGYANNMGYSTEDFVIMKLNKATGDHVRTVDVFQSSHKDTLNASEPVNCLLVGDYLWLVDFESKFVVSRIHTSLDAIEFEDEYTTFFIRPFPTHYEIPIADIDTSEVIVASGDEVVVPVINGPETAKLLSVLRFEGHASGADASEWLQYAEHFTVMRPE